MPESRKPVLRDSLQGGLVVSACGVTLDFGRQRLTSSDLDTVFSIAKEKRILEANAAMRSGKIVNKSEHRAALHTALRDPSETAPFHREVSESLKRMFDLATEIRSGFWRGCRGDIITDVINVGIGGSEVGPRAVYHALRPVRPLVNVHFMAGADGVMLDRILAKVNPFRTLVIISSKSFKTRETMVNATAIDQWLLESGITGNDRARHMVTVSADAGAAEEMNLPAENLFRLWEWVGGRFSVWSSIGLPDAIALGPEVFQHLLAGAHQMDDHVAAAPIRENLPALLALTAYWNSTVLGINTHCFLPYDDRLRTLVQWLQQLEMESLGKCRTPDDERIEGPTGQGVWGGHGNESQHSFYQWLREGTAKTSIDLVWCEKPSHKHAELHRVLTANAKAQSEALTTRDDDRYFNAVTSIRIDELTPFTLGSLMAMYEHKTTFLGTLYGINPFDQPGVEYGKVLSRMAERAS